MKPGTLLVGEITEWLDLVQARVRIARVSQVLQVAPRSLLLAGRQGVDEGVEVLASRAPDRHPRGRGRSGADAQGPVMKVWDGDT
jgi:hypothetical protein